METNLKQEINSQLRISSLLDFDLVDSVQYKYQISELAKRNKFLTGELVDSGKIHFRLKLFPLRSLHCSVLARPEATTKV